MISIDILVGLGVALVIWAAFRLGYNFGKYTSKDK
jgi:hypothetical protein